MTWLRISRFMWRSAWKTEQVNAPSFDARAALYGVLGIDLIRIHGIDPSLALKLIGECGSDLQAWPSATHFLSWLCLAPGNLPLCSWGRFCGGNGNPFAERL